jgi:hypothetical protein
MQTTEHTFTLKKGNVIKLNGHPLKLLEDMPLTVSDDLKFYRFATSILTTRLTRKYPQQSKEEPVITNAEK